MLARRHDLAREGGDADLGVQLVYDCPRRRPVCGGYSARRAPVSAITSVTSGPLEAMIRNSNTLKIRFCATLGEEPEVEVGPP